MIMMCNTPGMAGKHANNPQDQVAFLLAQVGAQAAQRFTAALEPLNYTPPESGILHLLSRTPGISQQELAGRLGMHASRLVAVIDALEKRGLVTRKENVADRRVYILELSSAGTEALAAIGRVARAHNEAMCAALGAKERERLAEMLRKVAAQQGLLPGVHPGYRNLGKAKKTAERRREK
jgi:DNA-binding MarR family transcriptional regulator